MSISRRDIFGVAASGAAMVATTAVPGPSSSASGVELRDLKYSELQRLLMRGFVTPNQVRAMEGLPPLN